MMMRRPIHPHTCIQAPASPQKAKASKKAPASPTKSKPTGLGGFAPGKLVRNNTLDAGLAGLDAALASNAEVYTLVYMCIHISISPFISSIYLYLGGMCTCVRARTHAQTLANTPRTHARARAHTHTRAHTRIHTQVHDDMSASLVLVDAAKNTDKYYILQLLAHKKQPATFYVFNRWGVYIILIAGVCAYINRWGVYIILIAGVCAYINRCMYIF